MEIYINRSISPQSKELISLFYSGTNQTTSENLFAVLESAVFIDMDRLEVCFNTKVLKSFNTKVLKSLEIGLLNKNFHQYVSFGI